MGFEIDSKIVIDILTSLDFKVKELMESYEVTVPTYRATKDISNGADLIEEIARIYGYENFTHEPLVQTLNFENLDSYYDNEYQIKEYLALLPYFEKYYFKTEDFFPLANIYLSQGELDKAKSAILKGILFSITNNDFRQIKYLCKC